MDNNSYLILCIFLYITSLCCRDATKELIYLKNPRITFIVFQKLQFNFDSRKKKTTLLQQKFQFEDKKNSTWIFVTLVMRIHRKLFSKKRRYIAYARRFCIFINSIIFAPKKCCSKYGFNFGIIYINFI